ncbi:unnamed protein product [Paramecium octaurelia]|uniref:Uncharacterized protein n=1 Tax=Paramecium octaurelia TaxID=43137 RepID=A0A8S1XBB6_PAROT|nr:unnamed protein product [Paramecium octaurelia]
MQSGYQVRDMNFIISLKELQILKSKILNLARTHFQIKDQTQILITQKVIVVKCFELTQLRKKSIQQFKVNDKQMQEQQIYNCKIRKQQDQQNHQFFEQYFDQNCEKQENAIFRNLKLINLFQDISQQSFLNSLDFTKIQVNLCQFYLILIQVYKQNENQSLNNLCQNVNNHTYIDLQLFRLFFIQGQMKQRLQSNE